MFNIDRRSVLRLSCAAGALAAAPSFAQRGKTIRLIVGFAPGTAPDTTARLVAHKLSENLQQSVVVENVPGAGGLIAARQAIRANPDGETLFLNTVSDMSIAPHIYNRLGYDPAQFALISQLVYADFILAVPGKLPVKTLSEYVAWAKTQKELFMATFGPGSPAHFGCAIFASAFGVKVEPVHYKTTGDAMGGVLSGEVPGVFVTASLGTQYVKDGRLKGLAVTSPQRMPTLSEVPTFTELGHPQVTFGSWFGLAAPPNTPTDFLERVSVEARRALQDPELKAKLEGAGFRLTGTTREAFAKVAQQEYEAWGKAARSTGFKAD
jgi:tripartite-type tricarboxylate transporter receptor subunit TctC